MKKLLLITLTLLFQACSFDGYKKDRDFRLVTTPFKEGRSIIITRTSTSYETFEGKGFDTDFVEMNWCKKQENQKCSEVFYLSPFTRKKFHSQYNYYSINPGSYYLDEIKEQRDHPELWVLLPLVIVTGVGPETNFNNSDSGWNKKLSAPNFASFETHADEIVYIGDLYFTFTRQKRWFRGKINLKIEDNYNDAIKYFYEAHPEFKNRKVIKRLAQPGVLLDSFDAGVFW